MDKKEPVFAEGLFFSRPRQGAPDYVKGSMSVEPSQFIKFLEKNVEYLSPKGWMNLDLKESKDGSKLYFQVNTWKPLVKPESLLTEEEKAKIVALRESTKVDEDIKPEDIPF